MKLPLSYYQNTNVVFIAQDLLGKVLCTNIRGELSAAIITETEAYAGAIDKASHAYGNRRTPRTESMFHEGGVAYVYLCYGIHHLFNVVCGPKDLPHAVLLRGIKPLEGISLMEKRRKKKHHHKNFSSGPGTATVALGITTKYDLTPLTRSTIWIEDRKINVPKKEILIGPRVGVDYAKEDANLPYRFLWDN